MPKYQVTFKGQFYDVLVSGDSSEQLAQDYKEVSQGINKALGVKSSQRVFSQATKIKAVAEQLASTSSPELNLDELSIPAYASDAFVEQKKTLTNWDTLFLLLHFWPKGLTNKQLRSLSEELGKPIRFSWFDGEFHRRDNEGLVVSKHVPGAREKLYFLAEPGKRRAEDLIRSFKDTDTGQPGKSPQNG